MSGSLTVATRNLLLDSLNLKTVQLHSSDPTESGLVGVIPGASNDFMVSSATGGAVQSIGSIEIDINVTENPVTVSHFSVWDGSSTPRLVATGSLSSSQVYVASGKYTVNTLTIDLNI